MEAYLIKHILTGKYLLYDSEAGLMLVGNEYINLSLWKLKDIKHLFNSGNYYDNGTKMLEVKKEDFEVYRVSIEIKEKIII